MKLARNIEQVAQVERDEVVVLHPRNSTSNAEVTPGFSGGLLVVIRSGLTHFAATVSLFEDRIE